MFTGLLRFTPTRVGKTSGGWRRPAPPIRFTPTRVGKTSTWARVGLGLLGSPPRVWGRPQSAPRRIAAGTVHPHACGEDGQPFASWPCQHGSPPRVWGRLMILGGSVLAITVHPHACGEDLHNHNPKRVAVGSPPRVWGRQMVMGGQAILLTVHPHACGEDYWHSADILRARGFTPTRVGKTGGLTCNSGRPRRFTPTRVGKTGCSSSVASVTSVHPHACGEDRKREPGGPEGTRFTPTRVGKTWLAGGQSRRISGSPPRVWGRLSYHSFLDSFLSSLFCCCLRTDFRFR